jgi:hypothetical protein
MTRELVAQTLTEERVKDFAVRQVTYVAGEAMRQMPSLQEAANMWLNQYRRGRFEVKVDTSDLAPRLQDLRDIARILILGLLVVGVLISSAILANVPRTAGLSAIRDAALIIGVCALGVAVVLILVLLWRLPRGGAPR